MSPPSSSIPKRNGVVLNEKLAVEIYKLRLFGPSKGKSVHVSRIFHVSPKTVRDIWNQKTWSLATCKALSYQQSKIQQSEISSAGLCSIPRNIQGRLLTIETKQLQETKIVGKPSIVDHAFLNDTQSSELAFHASLAVDLQHLWAVDESLNISLHHSEADSKFNIGTDDALIPAETSILFYDPFYFDWPFW